MLKLQTNVKLQTNYNSIPDDRPGGMELITSRSKLRDGGLKVDFFLEYLSKKEADHLYHILETTIEWKKGNRRQKYTYGDEGLEYVIWFSNGIGRYKCIPWEKLPILFEFKERLEKLVQHRFTTCVIQYYPHGKVCIKPHRDKEMKPGTTIVGLSVGATRYLRLARLDIEYNIDLPHGSVYIFRPPTNDWFSHSIPRDESVLTPRFSLTFRNY